MLVPPGVETHVTSVTHVIQLAVAPVFLLTAISTLINAMNTRLGRIVDRRRTLRDALRRPSTPAPAEVVDELRTLDRRVHLVYGAMLSVVLSGLLVCLVVAIAFIGALTAYDTANLVALLFIAAMFCMIVGLSLFLREVYVAVRANALPFAANRTDAQAPGSDAPAADHREVSR